MNGSRVVVGVSGSTTSTAAVQWAAVEAQLRGADLHVVLAHHWRIPGRHFESRDELLRTTGERVTAILDTAVDQARSAAPDVHVQGSGEVGDPVPILLQAAADADLLVVGGRSRATPGPLLTPVTSQIAAYASCPVAVVREGCRTDRNTVVVGIDDSPGAAATARTAFEEAALRPAATLLAVTAYTAPSPGVDPRVEEAALHRRLGNELAPWRDKHPEVPLLCEVVGGDPGRVLVDKSREAGLVVVGAGSRRDFEGLRLGPIRLHLLHHAECPVLIARAGG
jgi:nucleotide-binding universal stress UspA family protein